MITVVHYIRLAIGIYVHQIQYICNVTYQTVIFVDLVDSVKEQHPAVSSSEELVLDMHLLQCV